MTLDVARIRDLLGKLNEELIARNVKGEMYLAGGAVMCLAFHAREATKDVDAMLVPAAEMREAAAAVAAREGLVDGWVNDAVKGFFSENGRFDLFEEMSHLRLYVPEPGYLFAMKCLALRIGEEFQDTADVRVLIGVLGITSVAQATEILAKYYPMERYPARARYVLEELLQ